MTEKDPASLSSENIVAFLEDIFLRRGNEEYLGEPVTMAQHMLQGAHFAEEANEPEDIVVSALLHDIGHFTSEFGTFSMQDTEDKYHEEAGAELLEEFFPASLPIVLGIMSLQNAICVPPIRNILQNCPLHPSIRLIFKEVP